MRIQNKQNKRDEKLKESTLPRVFGAKSSKQEKSPIYNTYSNYNINLSIDSIHMTSEINPFDILRNSHRKFSINEISSNLFVRKYKLYIDSSHELNVQHNRWHSTYKYEFGALSQYTKLNKTVIYIMKCAYKAIVSTNRIDFALDINVKDDYFQVFPTMCHTEKAYDNQEYYNTYYSGKKRKHTLSVYDKNNFYKKYDFSYNPMKRIELRLYKNFMNYRKLRHILSDKKQISKLHNTIINEILPEYNITYCFQQSDFTSLKFDEVIYNFIAFLESDADEIQTPYKKFTQEIKKQTKILNKLKSYYKVKSITQIIDLIKEKKLNQNKISGETGINRATIKKIINHYSKEK